MVACPWCDGIFVDKFACLKHAAKVHDEILADLIVIVERGEFQVEKK